MGKMWQNAVGIINSWNFLPPFVFTIKWYFSAVSNTQTKNTKPKQTLRPECGRKDMDINYQQLNFFAP